MFALLRAAILMVPVLAGTDGAMPLFFEQQLEVSTAPASGPAAQNVPPLAIDAAGKLFPAVLKVGHLVNREKPIIPPYRTVEH